VPALFGGVVSLDVINALATNRTKSQLSMAYGAGFHNAFIAPTQNEGLRFRQSSVDGLRELEYIEGRNFDVVIRHAGSTSELPKAAEQLVQLKPDVIFAAVSAAALAAKQATSTIPIVVGALGNPVALGLAESDSRRPSGNLTGIRLR